MDKIVSTVYLNKHGARVAVWTYGIFGYHIIKCEGRGYHWRAISHVIYGHDEAVAELEKRVKNYGWKEVTN